MDSKVYVVIPVFNRPQFTFSCVDQLLSQDYPNIDIIISDGKSTDGSPSLLKQHYGDRITLLSPFKEQWWSGSMAIGMLHVLSRQPLDSDFILMMNDDTEFDSDYVSTLVSESQKFQAVVGSLTLDSRNKDLILDGGVRINWEDYEFQVKTQISPEHSFDDTIDVLPGRGTIIPIGAIRQIGGIDFRRFPHYIADYEFSARLKREGFRLLVSYKARIYSHKEATGLSAQKFPKKNWCQLWRLKTSRRSVNNIFDHIRFILSCSPIDKKVRALAMLFFRRITH